MYCVRDQKQHEEPQTLNTPVSSWYAQAKTLNAVNIKVDHSLTAVLSHPSLTPAMSFCPGSRSFLPTSRGNVWHPAHPRQNDAASWTYRAANISTFAFESGTRSLARKVEALYTFSPLCFPAFLTPPVSSSSSSNFLQLCSANCTTTNLLTCKDTEIFNLCHNFEECSLLELFTLLFLKTRFVTQPSALPRDLFWYKLKQCNLQNLCQYKHSIKSEWDTF